MCSSDVGTTSKSFPKGVEYEDTQTQPAEIHHTFILMVLEIPRIPASAFTSIFSSLWLNHPDWKNYTQVKIYHQPPSCFTTPKFNNALEAIGWKINYFLLRVSATLQGLLLANFEVNRSMHPPQVLVVVFDVLMLEVPEVLKSFSPRIFAGVIMLPNQTMHCYKGIRNSLKFTTYIYIYTYLCIVWSLQK